MIPVYYNSDESSSNEMLIFKCFSFYIIYHLYATMFYVDLFSIRYVSYEKFKAMADVRNFAYVSAQHD